MLGRTCKKNVHKTFLLAHVDDDINLKYSCCILR